MLLVYPMLVSQSVSKNIIPGLCKVMERYLLIRILQEHALRLRHNRNIGASVGESYLLENTIEYEIDRLLREEKDENGVDIEYGPPEGHDPSGHQKQPRGTYGKYDQGWRSQQGSLPGRQPRGYRGHTTGGDPNIPSGEDTVSGQPQTTQPQTPKHKPDLKINMGSFNTISLEPTYAEAEDFEGKVIYGVKVVAFPISLGTEDAAYTLFNKDWQRGMLSTIVRKIGRASIRLMYSLRNRFLRLLKLSPTITADPIKDIVYGANLKISDSVFLVLSTGDVGDEMLDRPKFIKKLMKLYWNSFIICDETKKEASICMKSFNGLCSKLNYSLLMTGINKDLGKVYDSLEQVQAESRPFFKLRRF